MTAEKFNKEVQTIHRIALINGSSAKNVDSLITKHLRRKKAKILTSLSLITSQDDKDIIYVGGSFVEGLTKELAKVLKKNFIILSPNTTGNKLKTLLGFAKYEAETLDKSGIYSRISY